MIRRIIHIDEEKCNGCGLCANACHEGAIGMVDGKARLLRDDYCDGLGDCLPSCPAGAISFVEREAAAYDEKAVKAHMEARAAASVSSGTSETSGPESQLSQWPVQIKLAPVKAPYFEGVFGGQIDVCFTSEAVGTKIFRHTFLQKEGLRSAAARPSAIIFI